jgi:colanic acid biosynthesis glycosyl transferase WcaI
MKVLLVCPDFPPVLNSAARLFYELAEDLSRQGHEVTVLTRIPERYLAGQERHGRTRFVIREEIGGIQVVRLKNLPAPRRLPAARALEQLWMALTFYLAGAGLPRHDAVIIYSPPLPLGLAGYGLARQWRGVTVINVQDLYPQTAIDLGLLRGKALIGLAERLERFLYQGADALAVHSEGNRAHVVSKGAPPGRVHVIPNWIDLETVKPGPRYNGWRHSQDLDEAAFVVSFAGTMGFAQGIEEVVQAADRLRQVPEVTFVLAGDGVFKRQLQEQAEGMGLRNMRLLPPQPADAYIKLLQASDACLVTLHKDLKTPVIPGKLQSVMAAGRPVILCANPASDARRMVEDAGCGLFVPAGDADGMAAAVLSLYRQRNVAEEMGQRGRRYAEREFDRQRCTQAYASLLAKATSPPVPLSKDLERGDVVEDTTSLTPTSPYDSPSPFHGEGDEG